MELEELRRKILTPRDGEENQEINGIHMVEERIQNERNMRQICVHVETEVADEEHLVIDELKTLMIRNETKYQSIYLSRK